MTIHLKNVMMKQEIQLLFKILMNEFFITDGNHCYNLDYNKKTCNYANTQWNNSNELTSFFYTTWDRRTISNFFIMIQYGMMVLYI